MATTMQDVAARAGVSVKTVSNVVNDHPHVSTATRDLVLGAIESLGYRMNTSARSLRRGRTGMLGLALPSLSLPYFAELADAMIAAADRQGQVLLIEQTGAERAREIDALRSVRRSMTDGLIFSPLALGQQDEHLLQPEAPLVLLGERIFTDRFSHVTMRNREAARAATSHLIARGRRRIAVVGVHPDEVVGTAALRLHGYEDALAEAGIRADPALYGEAGPWYRPDGVRAMNRILDSGAKPDAVFGMNDTLAIGALHVLQSRGYRVPEDVAVIGFDGIEETQYSAPTLSTVHIQRDEIAATAVQLLQQTIADPGSQPHLIDVGFQIESRASTDLPVLAPSSAGSSPPAEQHI
ncbi:MAG TPA: LacI family DNA-binding transcriptional regulator [Ruania sp.]|nr:LacI family DNA-binding transcriptional regulator [Ruania sp.]